MMLSFGEWLIIIIVILSLFAVASIIRMSLMRARVSGRVPINVRESSRRTTSGDKSARREGADSGAVPVGTSATDKRTKDRQRSDLLNRLRNAFDHIEHAVVIADENGDEVFLNSAAEALRESRDGRLLVDNAANEMLREALEGEPRSREVDLFGPPARTFSISAKPLRGSAGSGALVIVEDITMSRLTETVRRDFVANISHELKSPIGAMGLLADMIANESDPEVVERLSSRMVHEAERASRTVDDLLELASIEFAGEVDFAEEDVDAIVSDVIERIAPAAEQASVEIRVKQDYSGPLVCDRIQIASALYNLLDNAIKYSPTASVVEVSTRASRFAGMVEFVVQDRGIGIPRRDQDRIFERFYRVDQARSRRTGGTGLGLAIVRHVANNHGGEVQVESVEGVGTTFVLRISTAPGE